MSNALSQSTWGTAISIDSSGEGDSEIYDEEEEDLSTTEERAIETLGGLRDAPFDGERWMAGRPGELVRCGGYWRKIWNREANKFQLEFYDVVRGDSAWLPNDEE